MLIQKFHQCVILDKNFFLTCSDMAQNIKMVQFPICMNNSTYQKTAFLSIHLYQLRAQVQIVLKGCDLVMKSKKIQLHKCHM